MEAGETRKWWWTDTVVLVVGGALTAPLAMPILPVEQAVVISVGMSKNELETLFDEVTLAATFTHPYCIPHENGKLVHICRGLHVDLESVWAEAGRYI